MKANKNLRSVRAKTASRNDAKKTIKNVQIEPQTVIRSKSINEPILPPKQRKILKILGPKDS